MTSTSYTRLLLPGYPQTVARAAGLREIARLCNLLGCGEARLRAARLPDSGLPLWLADLPYANRDQGRARPLSWCAARSH
jgi:hypothetical protein